MVEPVELQDLEDAWGLLQTHLEWADDFWLVFVFTNDPRVVGELRERSASVLDGERSLRAWRCSSPAEVDAMVDSILADEPVDVHWIDLVRFDDRHGQPGWGEAWGHLLHRLNERRELLRRRTPAGGFVFASTLDRLDTSSGLAPDLWTIRSLVFRVESLAREEDGARPELEFSLARSMDERDRESRRNLQLARQAVDAARERGDEPGLARALVALANATEADEATAATQEAVEIYRKLVETRPNIHLPDLAMALNNLGIDLSSLGRLEEGTEATQEAVDIWRKLSEARPDADLPDLAMALGNLGNRLSSLGRLEEGTEATQEAVDIWRKLAVPRPDLYLPDLAMALINLGNRLSSRGLLEEGMDATQEAVDIWRKLSEARPDAYLPDLAGALSNLGNRLSSLGRLEEGMDATQEAIDIRRKLAEARPGADLSDLAMALNNLGIQLSSLGRLEEGMDATQEAIDIRRKLAEVKPDAYLPDLARSLGARATIEQSAEAFDQAAASFAEGLRCVLPSFNDNPQAHARLVVLLTRGLVSVCESGGVPIPDDLTDLVEAMAPHLEEEEPAGERD